jgi:cytochrome c peroxidase
MASAFSTRAVARSLVTLSKTTSSPLLASSLRTTTRTTRQQPIRQFFQTSRRQYSSITAPSTPFFQSNIGRYGAVTLGAALFGGLVYYATSSQQFLPASLPQALKKPSQTTTSVPTGTTSPPTKADYQAVYDAIATALWDNTDYDDGSYAPILLRLAWHSSGTYSPHSLSPTGGSNGATMRFSPESTHAANRGLVHARDFLEPIHAQFPWISYGDLWTLGGVCAVQEMQGPAVPWRPGRIDRREGEGDGEGGELEEGRLPDGSKGPEEVRRVFGRMGFSDQEMVALSGAHALGRCHKDRSGFEGPWTFSPTVLTNDFFRLLVEEEWIWREPEGGRKGQYKDKTTGTLMMLPSDMALVRDERFRGWVERYAASEEVFFKDFRNALVRLFELGVPFESEERWVFRSTHED